MIRFSPCSCPAGKITRIHRTGWMRAAFRSRALYHCASCGGRFLATPAQQAELGVRAFAERRQDPSATGTDALRDVPPVLRM